MKIFSCDQIRQIDAYTLQHEPVASIDLMERASGKIFSWITAKFSRSDHFIVFAGPGNNGGDGLALACMLSGRDYRVDTWCIDLAGRPSVDRDINRKRLEDSGYSALNYIKSAENIPSIPDGSIVIDAIFGSGLTRPVDGLAKEIINMINQSDSIRISVDIPSGLFCENNNGNDPEAIIKADFTITFQFPKISFMFAENYGYCGEWHVLPIGLHPAAIRDIPTPYSLLKNGDVIPLIKKRHKFDHKGNFGHGLLISGSFGKMGAAVLGAKAALRTGIGLLSCHIPGCGYAIMQSSVPEAMVKTDSSEQIITEAPGTEYYSAVGIGPGLGIEDGTNEAVKKILAGCRKPMVIDADALNILSRNREWLSLLPEGTILTPHPKEFERLAGKTSDGYARLERQIEFSEEFKCIVILKGAYTSVTLPGGKVFFNTTGNPGMATGGSGDVLTGIVLSLLSQGYTPDHAAILAVYLHGVAGDIAADQSSPESVIATDIINCIGNAFNRIRGS
jgi:NAD(P)H-hydrate epimerase